jgi:L-lactate dehydrogenase (cytochrome)/(S)-mandelate dehydrogenase
MKLEKAVNIEDLHRMARRRLPKVAFDFIEGGVEDERGIARNESAFARYCLMPRYLVDVHQRDQTAKLFDRVYGSPFGISPTGAAGLFRPGADLMLAESAARANIPFIMSGASTGSMEAAARLAPTHTWYQLYPAHDPKISEDLIRRARDAGLGTLVVTVDVPVASKRERNIRNGFGRPLKMTLPIMLEALTHPGWMASYLRHGTPLMENWVPYAPPGSNADQVADFVSTQMPSVPTWEDLEKFRQLWPRHLVVKGILNKDDAVRAADLGVDGIIISNHGGRQLDRAPASIEMLPVIREAVGDRITLMLDSGVRRGADIVTALALGARFVFVGRATLYGAAAAGIPGVRKAISILRREIDLTMGQIGCPSLDQIDSSFVYDTRR